MGRFEAGDHGADELVSRDVEAEHDGAGVGVVEPKVGHVVEDGGAAAERYGATRVGKEIPPVAVPLDNVQPGEERELVEHVGDLACAPTHTGAEHPFTQLGSGHEPAEDRRPTDHVVVAEALSRGDDDAVERPDDAPDVDLLPPLQRTVVVTTSPPQRRPLARQQALERDPLGRTRDPPRHPRTLPQPRRHTLQPLPLDPHRKRHGCPNRPARHNLQRSADPTTHHRGRPPPSNVRRAVHHK